MHRFDYHTPRSLEEAFGLMADAKGQARYIAGGTDLMVRTKQGLVQPRVLISLRQVQELQGIEPGDDFLVIKGMTLLRDIESSDQVESVAPALKQAVRSLANVQIRNVATLGGNLVNASPAADTPPPLLVYAAELLLTGPNGDRTVALEDFFLGPGQTCLWQGELLKEVRIPWKPDKSRSAFQKIGRTAKDLAVVNAAVCLEMQGNACSFCRLATGAVAPVPMRLKSVEDFLNGKEITSSLLDQVKAMVDKKVSPISDLRGSEAYRRDLAGTLIIRGIEQVMG